jgi:hypothetical protein
VADQLTSLALCVWSDSLSAVLQGKVLHFVASRMENCQSNFEADVCHSIKTYQDLCVTVVGLVGR